MLKGFRDFIMRGNVVDLAVGVVLGGLRQLSGTPAAPAVAHVSADMAGWFLR